MPLDFARTDDGDVSTLHLAGTLDVNTAPELGASIDGLVEERRTRVVVNLAALDLIDSSGVAVLVALYKRVRAVGRHVQVTGKGRRRG